MLVGPIERGQDKSCVCGPQGQQGGAKVNITEKRFLAKGYCQTSVRDAAITSGCCAAAAVRRRAITHGQKNWQCNIFVKCPMSRISCVIYYPWKCQLYWVEHVVPKQPRSESGGYIQFGDWESTLWGSLIATSEGENVNSASITAWQLPQVFLDFI